jgi:hypothetical protein
MTHYRVIRAFGPWSVGHVFTAMQGNMARTYMARRLVEEVRAGEVNKPKSKAMKSPANRMMSAPQDGLLSVTKA